MTYSIEQVKERFALWRSNGLALPNRLPDFDSIRATTLFFVATKHHIDTGNVFGHTTAETATFMDDGLRTETMAEKQC